jgi:tetratricopeptide (TPR) repeat protein
MKIKNILSILIITSLLASCNDSFLENPSKTALSTPVYFKNQADFEQAINGAYAPLRELYNGSNGAWAMGELRSDNTTYKYNPNDRGTIQGEFIKDFINDATNPISQHKYTQDYRIIARVNQILDLIDGVAFDEGVKNNIKGQAYFLRAFAYFDLVQYFGQVPLHLKPAEKLEDTALPLSSVEDVYNQIIADAKQAAGLLPNKATQEKGRATSGAANTLLGNVYIVQKKWAEAETVLKSVTGYSLISDYANVFDPAQKNNAESIFEIQFKQGTEGFASNFFYTFLVQPITAAEVTAVTGIPETAYTIEGYNIPTSDIINAYEANDERRDASIAYVTAGGISYPYIKKYAHPHLLTNNTDDNWPVYRYSEVLLFMAEALNEQGKTGEALGYLDQVRTRAGLENSTASGQSEIRDAIMQERRVELAFENKRWLDLVRTNTAESVMKAFGAKVKANPEAYYFPAGRTVSPSAYSNISTLFPIPSSEAALNPYF